jgi:hypothetical protein
MKAKDSAVFGYIFKDKQEGKSTMSRSDNMMLRAKLGEHGTEACGWEQIPRYLIRDRDGAYGEIFIRRVRSIGIRDRPTSPRSPWQNA